ncbi:hypothetical protein LR48_Vigan01g253500 [Vigna angularis]|uniref:Uncharacterized protein n=1 Tax=Phaseolus angularis TaxID=3914 RepID=A0A0L9TS73_PHAAN|nr:hypothetical protein LR48_Vigan01g253500 [Vigna angularis]
MSLKNFTEAPRSRVHRSFSTYGLKELQSFLDNLGSCTEHGMDLSGSPSSVLSLFLGSPSSLFVKDHNDRSLCSKDLVDEASKRKSGDNLSVVICFQQQPPPNLVAPRSRVHWSFSA